MAFCKPGALLLCLFAPSAWIIATIPPLWRDTDAYVQVTEDPLVATFWGHGPAYCYVAKVPLFAGEQLERWRGKGPPSRVTEPSQTALTDSGVSILIIGQHLALGAAAFYFIITVSHLFWIRLLLALTWASNALFYTFAHCVGSETLSIILIVLLVGKALRLIRSPPEPRWIDWYIFALLLCFCLLSRYVNLWLLAVLPAAFSLAALASLLPKPRQRQLMTRHLRFALIALAIGIASWVAANSVTQNLARKTKVHPHSRIGFTFIWRLHFLKTLSPESRSALLHKVANRTASSDARKLITLLEQLNKEGADLEAGPLMQRAIPLLYPSEDKVPWEKLDLAMNEMAFAFLLPPTPEHLHASATEFVVALGMPVTEISASLFDSTTHYFYHQDKMPECANLSTFRDWSAAQVLEIPLRQRYFRLWQSLTYNKALVVWSFSLLILLGVAWRKQRSAGAIPAFGVTLVGTGMLMIASTCLIGEFGPRYGLPMWELLVLSLFLLLGQTADLLALTGLPRDKERSAGQLPKLG
jgi:hypothetical protein